MVKATVRKWHDDVGWGVLDSPETPGGCWTHYTAIDTPLVGRIDGAEVHEYKGLAASDSVELDWATPGQDGFHYRAVAVRRLS